MNDNVLEAIMILGFIFIGIMILLYIYFSLKNDITNREAETRELQRKLAEAETEEWREKMLDKVKEKIAQLDHWTDKQETKAVVDTLIRDTLWNELPECYDDLSISRYRQQIYEYVYTRYPDVA